MNAGKYKIDMCTGAILPKLLRFVLPLMLSSVLQLVFNAADMIVVGNFGSENSLAAVGSTTSLVHLMTHLFLGLSIGTNVLCAKLLGAKDDEGVSKAVHTSIFLCLISGVILTVIGIVFANGLLRLMQAPDEVIGLSALYMKIYFGGMIFQLLYNFGSSILRAKGDTKRPLYYLTFAGIVNVLLNLVFVIVFNMDVAGVALATIISQGVSALLVIRCLVKETDCFKLFIKKIKLDVKTAAEIMRIGIPAGLQGCMFSISNVVLQSSINGFGAVVMAGSAAAGSIEGFVWVAMNAFSQGALTFMSQNVGGQKYSRLNKIAFTTCASAALTGLVLGVAAYLCGAPLLRLYDPRPEIIASGLTRMQLVCCMYCLCGLMDCMAGVIRGLGYSVMPTVVALLGVCGFRLLWVFTIFAVPQYHTEFMLFLCYPVSWVLTFIVHIICYWFARRKLPKSDFEALII